MSILGINHHWKKRRDGGYRYECTYKDLVISKVVQDIVVRKSKDFSAVQRVMEEHTEDEMEKIIFAKHRETV